MAIITPTSAWSDAIEPDADEIWQVRKGYALVATAASDAPTDDLDAFLLGPESWIEIRSGDSVRVKAVNGAASLVRRARG